MGFGKIIVTDKDHVLISDLGTIRIFKYSNPNIELVQTIDLGTSGATSGIRSMVINNSTLAIGLAEADGTGKVLMYEKITDSWKLKQEIKIGRFQDAFGSDIDINGDFMAIGAPAFGLPRDKEGRIYIYRKTTTGWIKECEFLAVQSKPSDWFGFSVAIHNNFVIAGSPTSWMHIYKFDNTWKLFRTDSILVTAISHSENNFMLYADPFKLSSFTLESDGNFTYHPINFNKGWDIRGGGKIIELKGNLALVDMEYSESCYLLKYENNEWVEKMVFSPDFGESVDFNELAIGENFVVLGGDDINSSGYSYVYFRSF